MPLNQVTTITTYIQDIIDAINTNGQSLLTSRSGIIQQLVGKIDSYFNETYQLNLNIFTTVQNQLALGKVNNSALFSALVADGADLITPYLDNLTLLKSTEL